MIPCYRDCVKSHNTINVRLLNFLPEAESVIQYPDRHYGTGPMLDFLWCEVLRLSRIVPARPLRSGSWK